MGDGSELDFEIKHICAEKCTMGSIMPAARAAGGSEARPESERRRPAADRRPVPSTGQSTVLPAHSVLRPPFTSVTAPAPGHGPGRRNQQLFA